MTLSTALTQPGQAPERSFHFAAKPVINKLMSHGSGIAKTPEPPYYAVIFTSKRTDVERGYGAMAERMVELAAGQPGFPIPIAPARPAAANSGAAATQ